MFLQILFLVGIALYEERRSLASDDKTFNFVEKAQAKSADFPMSLIEKLEEHLNGNRGPHLGQRELLTWVVKVGVIIVHSVIYIVQYEL